MNINIDLLVQHLKEVIYVLTEGDADSAIQQLEEIIAELENTGLEE